MGYTGMTWSGFRPSDDACELHYLIPANMLAVSVLNRLQELPLPDAILKSAKSLSREIDSGIQKFGVIEHPKYGRIFAYEVDGLGNYTLMDDANLPSLLGAPWYGYCQPEDEIYKNTRRFLLSENNPYYFTGKFGAGIGSQHTRKGYIWPIALAVQGLTSTSLDEKRKSCRCFSTPPPAPITCMKVLRRTIRHILRAHGLHGPIRCSVSWCSKYINYDVLYA